MTSASTMLVLVSAMMVVSAALWLFFVSTLERPIIRGPLERRQQTLNRICGVVLILFGIRVATMSK